MRLRLPGDVFKSVLLSLPEGVIPHLHDPKMLIDFLRDSYDVGGVTSLLALNGVYILIMQHNLDYPDFYPKLLELFDGQIFHTKYRARFFRLADEFLKSPALPGYLVAAFIKRLARLCLRAPPAGCHVAVRFIYNLLKRHPSCKVLIHRERTASGEDTAEGAVAAPPAALAADPYIEDERDPAKCRALESSLWEVQALQQHYHPDVARLPSMLEIPGLRKPEMETRRMAQLSYDDLLRKELGMSARTEGTPALTFESPTDLFGPDFAAGGWEA